MRYPLLVCAVAVMAAAVELHADITGNSRAAGMDQCVEPTDFMRRNHMEVLLHQRDDTVHQGIRTRRHSLVGCVSCHADKDADGAYLPINADGQFCDGCHAAVAVSIDCFQCHATRPDADARMSVRSVAMLGTACAR